MVSVSGVDVKFGRILLLIGLTIGLVVLYKNYGSGNKSLTAKVKPDSIEAGHPPQDPPPGELNKKADQVDQSNENDNGDPAKVVMPPLNEENLEPGTPNVEEKKVLPLETKTISIDIDNNICVISYIEVNSTGNKPKLLLLHGTAFNATTWNKQTGTLSKLREWGYRAVAVNLSPDTLPCLDDLSETNGVLMHKLVEGLMLQKVVIVSPSMSGAFSIPYVTSEAYQGEIAAYIPIAPVIAPTYKADDFSPLTKLKTLIVRGANDKTLGLSSLTLLEKIPNHQDVIIPDAGHPCYVEKPHIWHSELKTFLDSLEPTAV